MLAAVTRSPGSMVIEDVSEPDHARAGNVIVRPEVVGICGSDFHLYSGDVRALSGVSDFYPRIQGHEVSAIVSDPGDAGTVMAGERVAIWPLLPCGGCYPCRRGRPNVCVSFRLIGVHVDGGLQQCLSVPASALFPVGSLGIDVIGSSCATAADFGAAVRLISAHSASLAALFTHHYPLTRATEAFEFAMSRPPDAVKVVVWVESGGMLGRHKHRGPVSGFTLEGSWRYLEYDWVARPGGYVHESPGVIHTLVCDDPDGMKTIFWLNGSLEFYDDNDNLTETFDVFWYIDHYLSYCKAHGLPVNNALFV